jgi:hypothetical protein
MNLTGGGSDSRPSETVERMQRAQLWKAPSRLFAECCLPIGGERTAPGREQDRDRVFRYSESRLKKHSLKVRNCSRASRCALVISFVQKNTREFSPRVSSNSRRTSGLRCSCCSRGDGRTCRRLLGGSGCAAGLVQGVDDFICEIDILWRIQHDRHSVDAHT